MIYGITENENFYIIILIFNEKNFNYGVISAGNCT